MKKVFGLISLIAILFIGVTVETVSANFNKSDVEHVIPLALENVTEVVTPTPFVGSSEFFNVAYLYVNKVSEDVLSAAVNTVNSNIINLKNTNLKFNSITKGYTVPIDLGNAKKLSSETLPLNSIVEGYTVPIDLGDFIK